MILLRSLLFVVAFYLWTLLAAIGSLPWLLLPRPMAHRVLKIWSAGDVVLLGICGIRVEVRGREHIPTGPALIAAKHQCMFDIFGSLGVLPAGCYVLRKELARIPIFGWWAYKARMIVVDREGHAKALRKLLADAKAVLENGDRQIVIFPEGHRNAPGVKGDYQPGVAALYRELDLPCHLLALNSGVHWPAHGMMRKPGTIVFEFLPPIPAGLKRAAFMRELEERLEAASNALIAEGV